ncbi:hypothetical protein [Mycobacterium sp. 155]|uniref:hypothetical protein n=1 Tax=Mycobacterium sp. 155 TaxID=1157943 RepID=UPI00035DD1CB|nr:hypothetical protein [Mycobacterium sp. 155]
MVSATTPLEDCEFDAATQPAASTSGRCKQSKPTGDCARDRSGEIHGEEPTEYVKIGLGKYQGLDRDGNDLIHCSKCP